MLAVGGSSSSRLLIMRQVIVIVVQRSYTRERLCVLLAAHSQVPLVLDTLLVQHLKSPMYENSHIMPLPTSCTV